MLWDFFKPILNPEGCPEPGWYLFVPDRDGAPRSLGPFDTEEECARMKAQPCSREGCQGMVWFDPMDEIGEAIHAAGIAAGGSEPLCPDCDEEFTEWHKQKYGKPPSPVGVQ